MKILLIDDNVHFPEKGAPLFNMEMEYLQNAGHEVFSLGFSNILFRKSGEINIVKLPKNKIVLKYHKFFGSKYLQKEISTIIKSINPDVIHIHLLAQNALNVYNALPSNIPVVQTLHGPNFFCATSWGCIKSDSSPCELGISSKCYKNKCVSFPVYQFYRTLDSQLQSLLKEKVAFFHCPSQNILNVAKSHGFSNCVLIPLGIRDEFLKITNPQKDYNNYKVVFIGKIHPVKGLDVLLEAFQSVVEKIPQAILNIAGSGSHKEFYKNKVRKLNLSGNVNFLGFLKTSEIIELFHNSDLCVVPSIWAEQFGMVGPEALSCGVPVIGSNIGGIPEWLLPEFGWLVEPRNHNELSDKIIFALNNPVKLKRFGKAGEMYIRKAHNKENYLAALHKLFVQLI